MLRICYDGIDSDAEIIPTSAQLVAGYVDGDYAWTAAEWARFPNAIHVKIAVKSTTNAGSVLDCEKGDATPAESVDWVLMRRASGADPTVYCNQMDEQTGWPAVRAAFQARKVPEPHYWVADYDGNLSVPAGAVAKQYESTAHWDLSSVADYWPGVDPAPVQPTATSTTDTEEDDMSQDQNGYVTLSWSEGSRHIVQVACDLGSGSNQPDLRVVLFLEGGPVVLSESWKPDYTAAGKVMRFPTQYVAKAYGLELQPVGAPARYAASVS